MNLVVEGDQRPATVFGAFAAHLRAALAVRVIVPGAFGRARLASFDADRQNRADELAILVGAAAGDAIGHRAHVRAVAAQADAAPHVHVLCAAGVGARVADRGAVHRVLHRLGQGFVVVGTHAWMLADHFLDRHGMSPSEDLTVERGG